MYVQTFALVRQRLWKYLLCPWSQNPCTHFKAVKPFRCMRAKIISVQSKQWNQLGRWGSARFGLTEQINYSLGHMMGRRRHYMCFVCIVRFQSKLLLSLSVADIREAHAAGRMCSLIGVEGGHSLGNSMAVLRSLYDLGVRYLTLTSTCNTPWSVSHQTHPLYHFQMTEMRCTHTIAKTTFWNCIGYWSAF